MECGCVFIEMSRQGSHDWILSKGDPKIRGIKLFLCPTISVQVEKEQKRKKIAPKCTFPVSLTRARLFGWINLATAQIKCFNWLREYRLLKSARTDPAVNETWTVSRCFNEHWMCWNLVYHLQHWQHCRWSVGRSLCLMQQGWNDQLHLHPFFQIGISFPHAPLSRCSTCLPPRACGGTDTTRMQLPAGCRSTTCNPC